MPEWLLKKDDYVPIKDKDTFIDKSILALLKVISKLIFKAERKKNIFGINAILKVISALMLIILVSVSRSLLFILTIDISILFVVSLLSINEIKNILSVSLIMSFLTFVILIPSIIMGNANNSLLIIIKIFATITSLGILSNITEWNDITSTLKLFFIPDIFIFVFEITIRYIVILGEFSVNMLYAVKLRSVGVSRNKYGSLSGIMGTMFIKSKEMAEEMLNAMECRGFSGEYRLHKNIKFSFKDYFFIIINVIVIMMFIFFR